MSHHGFLSVKRVVILISISMMLMTYVSYTYLSTSPYDVDIVRRDNRTMSIKNRGGVVYIYKNVCIEKMSANSTKISVYDTAEEKKGACRLDVAGSENSLSNNWDVDFKSSSLPTSPLANAVFFVVTTCPGNFKSFLLRRIRATVFRGQVYRNLALWFQKPNSLSVVEP